MIYDLPRVPRIPRHVRRGDLLRHPLLPGGEAVVQRAFPHEATVTVITAEIFDVPRGVSNQLKLEWEPA